MQSFIKRRKNGIKNKKLASGLDFLRYVFTKKPLIMTTQVIVKVFVSGILPVLIAQLWGNVVDGLIGGSGQLIWPLVGLAIAGSLGNAYPFFTEVLDDVMRNAVSRTMQRRIHQKAERLPAQQYESAHVRDLGAKTEQTFFYGHAIGLLFSLLMVIASAAAFLYSFLLLWQQHKLLSLAMLLLIAVNLAKIQLEQKRASIMHLYITERREMEDLTTYVSRFEKVKEARAAGSSPFFIEKWKALQDGVLKGESRKYRQLCRVELLINIIEITVFIGLIALCLGLLLRGNITVGGFSVVILLVQQVKERTEMMIRAISGIGSSLVHIQAGYEFFELPEDTEEGKTGDQPESISCESVCYCYPESDNEVLQNINVELRRGEMVAVVGENGAGKSTLAKLLLGLLEPTEGSIYINGQNIKDQPREQKYREMTAVFQDLNRYPLTVKENVTLQESSVMNESEIDLSFSEALAQGADTLLMKEVGGAELSGGQWQQLALARCCHKNASIMVLDEPTAALDAFREEQLFDSFCRLAAGKVGVVITHRLGIVRLADRVLVMKNGQILGDGPHDRLLQENEVYREIWQSQKSMYDGSNL